VLTNGRDWRLYDDHIQNVSNTDRLVAEASTENEEELLDLLEALQKTSVETGSIERSVVATQLRSVLETQLTNKDSAVVKAVTRVVQQLPGMQALRPTDIAAYFAQRALAPIKQVRVLEPEIRESLDAAITKRPEVDTKIRRVALSDSHRFTKPVDISFGPSDRVEVSTWKAVAREILQRAADAGKLPVLPFHLGRSKGSFLAADPDTMRAAHQLSNLWFESHFSADDLMRNTVLACEAGGFDWREIRVSVLGR
jgi:hypothetical protein